jgi:peptidoglycan/LPS O-acetylase OafA/YrhL
MNGSTARRRGPRLAYCAGLDGLRGFAVAAVLLYHGGVSPVGGGFLGVEAFFVLSGFLITSLLLAEASERGSTGLVAFWGRRARRLLPALFAVVLVIGVYYALAGPEHAVPGLKDDGLATLLYFGNWHQIATAGNYFVQAGPVSPLKHTWSLAIEEQFYICWPLLTAGVAWFARRAGVRARSRRPLVALLVVTGAGVLIASIDTALRFHRDHTPSGAYYATDSRAGGLLVGAMLAVALALRTESIVVSGQSSRSGTPRRWLGRCGLVALVVVLMLIHLGAAPSEGRYAWRGMTALA